LNNKLLNNVNNQKYEQMFSRHEIINTELEEKIKSLENQTINHNSQISTAVEYLKTEIESLGIGNGNGNGIGTMDSKSK